MDDLMDQVKAHDYEKMDRGTLIDLVKKQQAEIDQLKKENENAKNESPIHQTEIPE